MPEREPRLFLDADGVLAGFDEGARRLFGMTPAAFEARHGKREFWRRIANACSSNSRPSSKRLTLITSR